MTVQVRFYSYFKELSGCSETTAQLPEGTTLGDLHERIMERFPALKAMQRSTLLAVGVDYRGKDFALTEGDEISLFPPVQGG